MDLAKLATESRLPESMAIDQASTVEMLHIINAQDQLVPAAVAREIPHIAAAVDLIAERIGQGGHLFYVGAGTSGRLGILDASEIPPTYGVSLELVQGVIAGGLQAVFETQEGAEDSLEQGAEDMASCIRPGDVVVGIAASGRTPYTIGALQEARRIGCGTIALTNNPDSPMSAAADITIAPVVGQEVIMGSTRMKAGTAQKLVLNMLSTGAMIKLGKVYSNLMVDMNCANEKLYHRAIRMVQLATDVDAATAEAALVASGQHAKTAIVSLLADVTPEAATAALQQAGGFVRQAVLLAAQGAPPGTAPGGGAAPER